jgi:hypothetical protein
VRVSTLFPFHHLAATSRLLAPHLVSIVLLAVGAGAALALADPDRVRQKAAKEEEKLIAEIRRTDAAKKVPSGALACLREKDFVGSAPVTFSPDGKRLAVGLGGGQVRIVDVRTYKVERTLEGFKGSIFALAFLPTHTGFRVDPIHLELCPRTRWRPASLDQAARLEPEHGRAGAPFPGD